MKPPKSILDPHFDWIASGRTNISKTFAKHGFVPPSEIPEREALRKEIEQQILSATVTTTQPANVLPIQREKRK